jgi:hypothetical protein
VWREEHMPGGPLLLPFLLGYIKYSSKEQKKEKED